MSPEFWVMTAVTFSGAAWGIGMAVREAGFVSAQHRARRAWEQTGRAVPGWSHHWQWAHDKTADAPLLERAVVNVFTTIVNVTHVHVRALSLTGGLSAGQGTRSTATPRVIPGQVVAGALPASRGAHALESLVGTGTSARQRQR